MFSAMCITCRNACESRLQGHGASRESDQPPSVGHVPQAQTWWGMRVPGGAGGGFGLDASIHMPPDLTFCPVSPRGCAHSSQQPGSGPCRKLGWCHVGVHGALLLGQVRPCSPRIHTAGCRHLGAELLGPARRQCGGVVSARRGDLQGRRGRDGEGERRCLLTDAASLLPPPPQFLLI